MSTTAGLVVGAGAAALAFLRSRKNAAHSGVLVEYAHLNAYSPLIQAILANDEDALQAALDADPASANERDRLGHTPLYVERRDYR
jgi:hypothetical protein